MANQISKLLGAELNAHAILAAALGSACLLVGTAARNERAVFLTEGSGLSAKAFSAMVPPPSTRRDQQRDAGRRSYDLTNDFAQAPRRGVSRPGPRTPIDELLAPGTNLTTPLAPQGTSGAARFSPDGGGAPQFASLLPSQFPASVIFPSGGGVGTATGTGGTGTGGTGTGGTGTGGTGTGGTGTGGTGTGGTGTGGTGTGGTGTGGTGTGGTGPGGGDGTTLPTGPVAAVPEAATWEMLLAGFFAIGFTLRRRNATGSGRAEAGPSSAIAEDRSAY